MFVLCYILTEFRLLVFSVFAFTFSFSSEAVEVTHVGVNPELRFRPQLDPQTTLIRIKSSEKNLSHPYSYMRYKNSMDDFLSSYLITDNRGEQIINCDQNSDLAYLESQFDKNKVCRFEVVEMFGPNNMCTEARK